MVQDVMSRFNSNIQARKDAEELVQLVGEQPARFWEVLRELAIAKLPERHPPMTEREAISFEAETMPYGKHAGSQVGIVGVDYLLFLTEGDEFSRQLKRYVKSNRFYNRQQTEND